LFTCGLSDGAVIASFSLRCGRGVATRVRDAHQV
jgi:hypothetical protein